MLGRFFSCLFFFWNDVHVLRHLELTGKQLYTFIGKFHDAIRKGEERVSGATADVHAWANGGSTLANQYIANTGKFTGIFFCPEALTLRIAAV